MEKRIFVKKDVCIGCGLCVNLSSLFTFGEDGLAEPTVNMVNENDITEAQECASSCPVNAIEIDE